MMLFTCASDIGEVFIGQKEDGWWIWLNDRVLGEAYESAQQALDDLLTGQFDTVLGIEVPSQNELPGDIRQWDVITSDTRRFRRA